MLGKLAKWLRVLGYDVIYLRQARDAEILASLSEGRVLLTRGRRAETWSKQGSVFVVNANDPKEQLREVVQGLGLAMVDHILFSRCLNCNSLLQTASREEVWERVPEYIWQVHDRFHRCGDCGRFYWTGSHSERMRQLLGRIFAHTDPEGFDCL
jgi:uncharacterized protein with PIN domain